MAHRLLETGVASGHRVIVMLPHHPDHIFVLLALIRLGAITVPVNTQLRGASLAYILENAEPTAVICDSMYAGQLLPELTGKPTLTLWRTSVPADAPDSALPLPMGEFNLQGVECPPLPCAGKADDVVAICYTSGTTGPPKGVLITDKMCRCAATSSLLVSGMHDGDIPLFWEPMYHLFGIEVLILALLKPITLAMVECFSASQFWQWARASNATHIHYVGGVLQLLLKQPPSPADRCHSVRVVWGGGCPPEVWEEFEARFGVRLRDTFGMTETSALNLINTEGVPGSVGRPLPYFEAKLVDDQGKAVRAGQLGELLIRGKEPGLTTPGYFRNDEATRQAIRDGWLHTGDLLKTDENGLFYFFSRKKDCVRRRGENVSAWEVEHIINKHPEVEESALVSVDNEFGDEDLKVFIKRTSGADLNEPGLLEWCESRMARFQIPRFVAFIDEFPKTSTQRIQKHRLSKAKDDCWDAEKRVAQ
ncbi:ATP-dependent acyl-CoA ligase [Paralcaligenes ginsengisoli]